MRDGVVSSDEGMVTLVLDWEQEASCWLMIKMKTLSTFMGIHIMTEVLILALWVV